MRKRDDTFVSRICTRSVLNRGVRGTNIGAYYLGQVGNLRGTCIIENCKGWLVPVQPVVFEHSVHHQ